MYVLYVLGSVRALMLINCDDYVCYDESNDDSYCNDGNDGN
jgi:hypothetical protein